MVQRIIAFIVFLSLLLIAMPAHAAGPVILVSATTDPINVSPGDDFTLKLKVKNDGSSKASNLIVTLDINNVSISETAAPSQQQQDTPTNSPISVVGQSNVRYLGSVAKGAEKETAFRMISDGSARSGTYNLNVRLDYDSARAQNQVIGIVLIRKADLRITQVSIPNTVEAGKSFKFTADIVNAGNYPTNGVSAELFCDGVEIKSPNYFIGTLEASDADTYETMIKPLRPGDKDLKLKISYIDDFNRLQSVVKDFKVKVEQKTNLPAKEKRPNGFLAKITKFFKALLGLGGDSE
ncbi:MAG: hypothetical protein IBX64_07930 [Actinobacteria bacterium]|nr:hypothetical protein [Actinomycetota bacterium]